MAELTPKKTLYRKLVVEDSYRYIKKNNLDFTYADKNKKLREDLGLE